MSVKYRHLGALLKEARLRKRMTIEQAAMMLGFTNSSYLWRCEVAITNFPAKMLARAMEVYGLPAQTVIEASKDDFSEALVAFFSEKEKKKRKRGA